MSKWLGTILSLSFFILSFITCNFLWTYVGWPVYPQAVVILLTATLGEHYVSGKGYYHYTPTNGAFLGRVPLWIPFMWVFAVQGALLLCLIAGFAGTYAILLSGFLCLVVDFGFVEPYMSSRKGFWLWSRVDKGYFSFLPMEIDRFTAPPGNYIVWFLFPFLLNSALYLSTFLM